MYQRIASYHWTEPLEALQSLGAQPHIAFLYSAQKEAATGRYSFLAWDLAKSITGSSFSQLPKLPSNVYDDLPLWFGFLGYEMRIDVEKAARLKPTHIAFPDMCWNQYVHLMRFDHVEQKIEYFTLHEHAPMRMEDVAPYTPATSTPYVLESLYSNFSAQSYQRAIAETVEAIGRGDFYQANLTRKFLGEMEHDIDAVALFCALCEASPAPYSALIRMQDAAIISASPECFLSVDAQGAMHVRPIKGSARRGNTPEEDAAIQQTLLASEKDHAENLMIVDLMRHDLARVAVAGSVKLDAYAALHSYATIHHLVSTITAHKKPDASLTDILRALFPPGSMTGAPKIAAMQWCAQKEGIERGVYSGALGWLGGGGTCDLSVVIRTVLVRGKQFEFQAGGGIVADSDPMQEWQEMLTKTRGITTVLGIDPALMEAL